MKIWESPQDQKCSPARALQNAPALIKKKIFKNRKSERLIVKLKIIKILKTHWYSSEWKSNQKGYSANNPGKKVPSLNFFEFQQYLWWLCLRLLDYKEF